jgi:hypothetical protein
MQKRRLSAYHNLFFETTKKSIQFFTILQFKVFLILSISQECSQTQKNIKMENTFVKN